MGKGSNRQSGTSNGNSHAPSFWREHGIEVIIAIGVAIIILLGITLNREVGELASRMSNLDGSLNDLKDLPTTFARLDEKVNTISRDVDSLRSEQRAATRSFTQGGRLTGGEQRTSTGPQPTLFRWELQIAVDPADVVSVVAELVPPVPGVAVTAELNRDGTGCTMMLHGSEESLSRVPPNADAQVTVTTRS